MKQVDRLLSDDGVVMEEFFARWAPYMVGCRTGVLVALDWTSFARGGSLSFRLIFVRDGFEIGAEGRVPVPPPASGYVATVEQ